MEEEGKNWDDILGRLLGTPVDLKFCTAVFHVGSSVLVAGPYVIDLKAHASGHSLLDCLNVIPRQSEMNGLGSLPVSAPSDRSGRAGQFCSGTSGWRMQKLAWK